MIQPGDRLGGRMVINPGRIIALDLCLPVECGAIGARLGWFRDNVKERADCLDPGNVESQGWDAVQHARIALTLMPFPES